MANSDKNILITPNIGSSTGDPSIVFSAANANVGPYNITARVYPVSNGTLSFEGNTGQLFSITNNLTGTIFSVNDISGIPSIEVLDTGIVKIAQYNGNVIIAANTTTDTVSKLVVNGAANIGSLRITSYGNVISSTGDITAGNITITSVANVGSLRLTSYGNIITSTGNISAANLTVSGVATAQMVGYSLKTTALGNVSGNTTINVANGNFVTATVTGTTNWTFSGATSSPNASGFVLELINGGSAAQTWPGNTKWPSATAPTLTSSGVDVLVFITDDGGTTWRGVASMINSS
jgi:hypothetical protein